MHAGSWCAQGAKSCQLTAEGGGLVSRVVPHQNSTTRNGDESQVNFPIMIAGKARSERHATAYPRMQTTRMSVPLVRETVGDPQVWTDTLW